ncbi:hypothetical protein ACWDPV_17205 [Gordonia sp. NPDC003504]
MTDRPDPDRNPQGYAAVMREHDVDARLRRQDRRYGFSRYLPPDGESEHRRR